MTIFLILGAVAGLYVLALLFRLASYALPVYAGLTCAFLLLGHDVGYLGAILGGLAAGIATLLIGQGLIAFIRSPMLSSEEHTSELQSLMRTSYAVFCWKKTTIQHL